MEILKVHQEILALYDSNLVALYSINEIAKLLEKPYPYVNRKVSELISCGVVNKTIIGRSYLCSLNLESDYTILLLSMLELEKKNKQDFSLLDIYISKKSQSVSFHSVVHSAGRVFFIVHDLKHRLDIQKQYPDSLVLDKQEFQNYLVETDSIFREHVVIYGRERFFEMIREVAFELKKRHSPLRY